MGILGEHERKSVEPLAAAAADDPEAVFVSTDPTMEAKSIIETFARRWSLEHTFHECKNHSP